MLFCSQCKAREACLVYLSNRNTTVGHTVQAAGEGDPPLNHWPNSMLLVIPLTRLHHPTDAGDEHALEVNERIGRRATVEATTVPLPAVYSCMTSEVTHFTSRSVAIFYRLIRGVAQSPCRSVQYVGLSCISHVTRA
jgi:hypothetical protein